MDIVGVHTVITTQSGRLCKVMAMAVCVPLIAGPSAVANPAGKAPVVLANEAETIYVHVGQSAVVHAPWPVARVSITQPSIADVQVLTPSQVLVIGNDLGITDMILWSEQEEVWRARVNVIIDLTHFRDELTKIFPECELDVIQSQDVLVVQGNLCRVEQVAQLRAMLDAYGVKYVDATSVAGVQQVMLQVRVAEASRAAIRSLGLNAFYAGTDVTGGLTLGPDGGGALNPINIGVPAGTAATGSVFDLPFQFLENTSVGSAISLFAGIPSIDLQLFLQALAENQYLRLLAEPTLVALSGEEASFLAGGEFPVPIVQGGTGAGGTSITIEYKEFGIRLNFLPQVLGEGRIRLYVAPEVSELSDVGAVEIEGFRVPSLLTRRAETTLELNSGQTFAMAGLLSQSVTGRSTQIPLLGDLPILGTLFRSVRYKRSETELLVLVTASLVEPASTTAQTPVPGDLHVEPDDWELYIDGRLEGKTPALAPADAALLKELGLDRLRGPGGWVTYVQAPAVSEVESTLSAPGMPHEFEEKSDASNESDAAAPMLQGT